MLLGANLIDFDGTDFNNLTNTGLYKGYASISHSPVSINSPFFIKVCRAWTFIWQLVAYEDGVYSRTKFGSASWSTWQKL